MKTPAIRSEACLYPGAHIGALTLEGKVSRTKWLATCDCGSIATRDNRYLITSRHPNCGAAVHRRGRGPINLEGLRYGRLVVMRHADYDNYGNAVWECRCDCGKTCMVRSAHLRRGAVRSCGCLRKEFSQANLIPHTHGT